MSGELKVDRSDCVQDPSAHRLLGLHRCVTSVEVCADNKLILLHIVS